MQRAVDLLVCAAVRRCRTRIDGARVFACIRTPRRTRPRGVVAGSNEYRDAPVRPTPRRSKRWRRLIARVLAIVLFHLGAGVAGVEAYIESVPLPGVSPVPQASVLYYRDGRTILARVGVTDHSDVSLSEVPVLVRQAVLAAEDRDFYSHGGVSPRGVVRALVADVGGDTQGASDRKSVV